MDAFAVNATAEADNPATRGLRILVIDDDESVGAAIRSILGRRGGETELASRACAGIQALGSSRFDVVLIDVFMPGMSGLDAIGHIRQLRLPTPIIAMSGFRLGSSQIDYVGMAMQRGASGYLGKPFVPQQLVEVIQRSLSSSATPAKDSIQ
jgi:DNA-binding NtrC family response regulator